MRHGKPAGGYAAAVKRDKTQNPCNLAFDAVLGMDMSISEVVKIEKRFLCFVLLTFFSRGLAKIAESHDLEASI